MANSEGPAEMLQNVAFHQVTKLSGFAEIFIFLTSVPVVLFLNERQAHYATTSWIWFHLRSWISWCGILYDIIVQNNLLCFKIVYIKKEIQIFGWIWHLFHLVTKKSIFHEWWSLDKRLDKQYRPRSDCFFKTQFRLLQIKVFPVCSSGKHFVNSIPDNILFENKKKCSKL